MSVLALRFLKRLLPFFRTAPQARARAARAAADGRSAPPRGKKPSLRNGAAFYLISAACHVAALVALVTYAPELLMRIRPAAPEPIQTEVEETPDRVSYETPEMAAAGDSATPTTTGEVIEVPDFSQMPKATEEAGDVASTATAPEGPLLEATTDPLVTPREPEQKPPIKPVVTFGGAKPVERAIAAALNWLQRHQNDDGHWSLAEFESHCQDEHCSGAGTVTSDAAATALALLPFTGAGLTEKSPEPFGSTITKGVAWLVAHQQPNGDLSADGEQRMYTHALATLALCESGARSQNTKVQAAAQRAVDFIQTAQNKTSGGWHYEPGGLGNTSILAWQMLALQSAQRCGLKLKPECLAGAEKWLQHVSTGPGGGLICYEPQRPVTGTMTAVGLVCRQGYASRGYDSAIAEGRQYLTDHPPREEFLQDAFYWYWGSLALRHGGGPQWDAWQQRLRRNLCDGQTKTGCAAGSWHVVERGPEAWTAQGGRLLTTSLAVQLLELQFGHLPTETPSAVPPVQTANPARPTRR